MRPWHSCSTVRVHARALMDCLLRGGGGRGGEGREKGRSRALTNAPAWARTQKSSRARAGTNARGRTHTHTHTHMRTHATSRSHARKQTSARALTPLLTSRRFPFSSADSRPLLSLPLTFASSPTCPQCWTLGHRPPVVFTVNCVYCCASAPSPVSPRTPHPAPRRPFRRRKVPSLVLMATGEPVGASGRWPGDMRAPGAGRRGKELRVTATGLRVARAVPRSVLVRPLLARHCGMITASCFGAQLVAEGEPWRDLLRRNLAGQSISWPAVAGDPWPACCCRSCIYAHCHEMHSAA